MKMVAKSEAASTSPTKLINRPQQTSALGKEQ